MKFILNIFILSTLIKVGLAQTSPNSIEKYREELPKLLKELKAAPAYALPYVQFNVAQTYFYLDSTQKATEFYQASVLKLTSEYKSVAYNHLGILSAKQPDLKPALELFKTALKANPQNEQARFNFELTKRRILEQKPPPPPAAARR